MSVLDYALPQRPPQPREEERDPSERALPRRSSSPVIGSPPVRAVPIGTPPKQAAAPNFNQQVPSPQPRLWLSSCRFVPGGLTWGSVLLPSTQILCPKPVHIRAAVQQRYPPPYGDRMSPNQLCNVPVPTDPALLLVGAEFGVSSLPRSPRVISGDLVPLFCCFSPEFLPPGPPVPPQCLSRPHPPAASAAARRSPGTNPLSLPPGPPTGRDPPSPPPS